MLQVKKSTCRHVFARVTGEAFLMLSDESQRLVQVKMLEFKLQKLKGSKFSNAPGKKCLESRKSKSPDLGASKKPVRVQRTLSNNDRLELFLQTEKLNFKSPSLNPLNFNNSK